MLDAARIQKMNELHLGNVEKAVILQAKVLEEMSRWDYYGRDTQATYAHILKGLSSVVSQGHGLRLNQIV